MLKDISCDSPVAIAAARNSPPEHEYKQCVQHDIAACRRNACFDGCLRKPVRLDQNFQIVGCHIKRNKCCDYSKILLHIVNRLIRCTRKSATLSRKSRITAATASPTNATGNHAAGKNFVRAAALAPAFAYGSARACSDCKQDSQCECRIDNRHRKIYCRQCIPRPRRALRRYRLPSYRWYRPTLRQRKA